MTKSRVTVIDIARAAGVSKSTVSLVLQASPLVNEQTRAKVNAAIRELGYVYNRGAANLRQTASSKIVGIVVNDLTNSFFAELAVGMDMVMQSADDRHGAGGRLALRAAVGLVDQHSRVR